MRGSPNSVFNTWGSYGKGKRLGSLAGIIFVAWQIFGIVKKKPEQKQSLLNLVGFCLCNSLKVLNQVLLSKD